MEKPTILITNDDGYFADGLAALRQALEPLGQVVVVAPDSDCSGVSHKLSLNTAMRLHQREPNVFVVKGTPVDCVHLAIHGVFEGKLPDLLVSGINHGPNLGEDTAYSGTVSAAYEGQVQHIPSMAISVGNHSDTAFDFTEAAKVAHTLANRFLNEGDPFLKQAIWNVNVPCGKPKGVRVVPLDKRSFKSSVVKRVDPRGKAYYWMGPYKPVFDNKEQTDYGAFSRGYVSMTPLKVEMTHHEVLTEYEHNAFKLD